MAKIELDGRIGHKRDTDAALTQSSFVPLDGELVLAELDGEVRLKAGDGVRTYAELPFLDAVLREEIAEKADADHTHAEATESAGGFMSPTDKEKLDGIEENANNYTHPTYFTRDSNLYKIRVNNLGHVSGAVPVTKDDITALGIPGVDTTYDPATTSSDGLMSAYDKIKLDGIAANANNYTHPTYTSRSSGLYKITVNGTGHVSAATAVTKSDLTALGAQMALDYSTAEQSTGVQWTDGRLIYRKTISGTMTGSNGFVQIGQLPAGVAQVVGMYGTISFGTQTLLIPNAFYQNLAYMVTPVVDGQTISLALGSGFGSSLKRYALSIEYTKNTN